LYETSQDDEDSKMNKSLKKTPVYEDHMKPPPRRIPLAKHNRTMPGSLIHVEMI
jgi:hypothetical protein